MGVSFYGANGQGRSASSSGVTSMDYSNITNAPIIRKTGLVQASTVECGHYILDGALRINQDTLIGFNIPTDIRVQYKGENKIIYFFYVDDQDDLHYHLVKVFTDGTYKQIDKNLTRISDSAVQPPLYELEEDDD